MDRKGVFDEEKTFSYSLNNEKDEQVAIDIFCISLFELVCASFDRR